DLSIYVDGALSYSSSIPIGARHISNDIAVGLRVSLDSAEKIKIFLSKSLIGKKKNSQINLNELDLPENVSEVSLKNLVDGIIAPRLEEIFKLIFEEIEKSELGQQIPSGLVITGGGALTIGMLETGKRVVGLPIRLGFPEKVSGLVDEIMDPQYSTTVGLLLYGQKDSLVDKDNFKNFGKILKDFKLGNSVSSFKNFIKQFIP
ncbi:MAG: cell division FtsA domain-containing protein, partial [Candidatus Roizmanbacteria bacterium]|nr:cell division FtsA domain-containing protein [Candidatus Roizmanbacteria bacterium]